MVPPKQSQDMPFAAAALFSLIGASVVVGVLFAWVGPALWVQLAYRPAAATVTEKRLSDESAKGGSFHRLEVFLKYRVGYQDYGGWVRLPKTSRKATGPDADAVLSQLAVGDEVTCYHDPISPDAGVVLDNCRFEWPMLLAVLFPLLFLVIGVGGMIGSYRKTFPRGPRAAAADLLRRVPRRFYPAAGGVLLVVGTLVLVLRYSAAFGGWTCPLLLAGIGLVVLLARRAARFGAVALPSPEQQAAASLEANRARAPGTSVPPAIPATAESVEVDRGAQLPVRLKPDWARSSGCSIAIGVAYLMLLVVCIPLALASRLVNRFPAPLQAQSKVALVLLSLLGLVAALFVIGRRVTRYFGALAVELSGHPLRAGQTYRVAVHHPRPDLAERVRLELVCEEEATQGKSTKRHVAFRQPVDLDKVPGQDEARAGQLEVPAGAPASFKLDHHQVAWRLEARVGRGRLWRTMYPVTVEAAGGAGRPVPAAPGPLRLDEGVVSLWVDGDSSVFQPGDVLSGGYAVKPSDDGPLRTAEVSVLWTTEPSGPTEIGVCHYEDLEAVSENDLRLYQRRTFQARLPAGPLSYAGQAVEVRWLVRLRLRYVNGEERVRELLFRLGAAPPAAS